MAVVVGNLSLLPDVSSPRTFLTERKPRPLPLPLPTDVVLGLGCRRGPHFAFAPVGPKCFEAPRVVAARGKANSKVNGVDFVSDGGNGSGNGNGGEEDEEAEALEAARGWQKEMIQRAKEMEEMKELENKAEELQNEADQVGEGETEEQKRIRVRKELEKVAQEQAERRATAELMFELGQKAYGKGMYDKAVEFLEAALTIIPRSSLFGGEIQIWLAMAYEANDRHADCIELYQQLELTHPSPSIRRQAADLRYISQAPKLKITEEERVPWPSFCSSYDSYGTWFDKDFQKEKKWNTTNQLPSSRDFLGDLLVWRPPKGWEKSRVFWVSLTLWLILVGAAVFLQ